MMPDAKPGRALADGVDIVRYAGARCYDPQVNQIDGSAFFRKPRRDEDGLSVTRRGYFSNEPSDDLTRIRSLMQARMEFGAKAWLVEVNVGAIRKALAEFDQGIDVVEDPLEATADWPANEAHALIVELPYVDMTVGSLSWTVAGDRIAGLVHARYPARG